MSENKPLEIQRARAAAAMARAFDNDLFFRAIMADFETVPDERECRLQRYFLFSIEEGYEIGRVVIDPVQAAGASVWITEHNQGRLAPFKREKQRFVEDLLGPEGLVRYREILAFMSSIEPVVDGAKPWYLSLLGVDPDWHGRGVARTVMESALREADLAGVPCYLETFTARAEAFYSKLGFRTRSIHREPVTGGDCRIMVRPAGSKG